MDRIILPDDVVEIGGFDIKVTFPDEERRPPVIVKFVRRNWAVVTFADRLSRVRIFYFKFILTQIFNELEIQPIHMHK